MRRQCGPSWPVHFTSMDTIFARCVLHYCPAQIVRAPSKSLEKIRKQPANARCFASEFQCEKLRRKYATATIPAPITTQTPSSSIAAPFVRWIGKRKTKSKAATEIIPVIPRLMVTPVAEAAPPTPMVRKPEAAWHRAVAVKAPAGLRRSVTVVDLPERAEL